MTVRHDERTSGRARRADRVRRGPDAADGEAGGGDEGWSAEAGAGVGVSCDVEQMEWIRYSDSDISASQN